MRQNALKLIVVLVVIETQATITSTGGVVANSEFEFEALQCNDVRTVAAYSGRKYCDPKTIREEYGISDRAPGGVYTVIQYNGIRKFKGAKCEKRVSSITAVCGAFSHSKLVTPPDVLKPVKISAVECMDIVKTQLVTTEDQRQIRMPLGTTVTYKYIESGSVTLSHDNVACEGGEMRVLGKAHENVIKLVTVTLTVIEVDVSEKQGRLKTGDGILPRACQLGFEGCALEDQTLVLDLTKINLCPYTWIRAVNFETFSLKTKHMYINDEHKILLEVMDKIVIPKECVLQGHFIKTNFERLFLFSGELGQSIDLIDPLSIDLELETRVADFYLSYWSLTVIRESEARWQSEICNLATAKMNEDQVVLHDNHILKLQGEMVAEFPCEKMRVRTRAGHKMEEDQCLDHLPVFLPDNQIGYLAPITRILEPRSAVTVINCSVHYPYLFEDVNGQMITANPAVQVVTVALNDYHHLDAKSQDHDEMFSFSSLLYTKEEIQSYEQMILGHSGEKAVTKQFSSFYCSATGECSASRSTKDFQWQKLVNPEEMMNEWYEEFKNRLIWWGTCWGCLDSIVTILQLVMKLCIVFKNVGKRQLTKGSIFRFVFLPGHELINLFPRPDTLDQGSYRVQQDARDMQEMQPVIHHENL